MKLLACVAALAATVAANVAGKPMPKGANVFYPRQAGHHAGPSHGWSGMYADDDPSEPKDAWGCYKPQYRPMVTIRASEHENDSVADDFLWALHKANNGGTLYLREGETYVIGKALNLTFLNDVHVQLDGEILFTDDIEYWQANGYYYDFQKSITFWAWGGNKIQIYGTGTLNGNGQAWYDGFAGREILDEDNTYYRPILFLTDNATDISITGIHFLNSPCWTNFLVRSKNVVYDRVRIDAYSMNENLPKNTDGWDSLNVDGLTVTNSEVDIGDDCFSPKPNTSNIFVQNLWCNNTHGVSMGSLGQYPGVLDYIENAYIQNVTMLNAENGGRIKAWAGPDVGYGYVRNITYKDMYVQNTDWPVLLDQCYFNLNETTCRNFPSRTNFTDIHFSNFTGQSSGRNGDVVARLVCSPEAVCENITLSDINITNPNQNSTGTSIIECDGITGGVGLPCVSANDVSVGG